MDHMLKNVPDFESWKGCYILFRNRHWQIHHYKRFLECRFHQRCFWQLLFLRWRDMLPYNFGPRRDLCLMNVRAKKKRQGNRLREMKGRLKPQSKLGPFFPPRAEKKCRIAVARVIYRKNCFLA